MAQIEVKDLRKIYHGDSSSDKSRGTQTIALDRISFTIEKGEFVGIMGPSGSGKSTLLHILGFLEVPTDGIYLFEGRNALDYTTDESAFIRNKRMGFIFQAFNLLPKTSVLENVKLPLLYSDVPESKWNSKAKAAIEAVQLSHRMYHEPAELSGGEKQRVAIARALVNDPQVIFADEPTGNLDSKSGRAVMETIEGLNDAGHTIILITHETSTAEHAKRIIHIKDGTVERDEKVAHRKRAEKEYTK
jgi:putative ABC transport system ATP-binding protein